MIMEAWKKIPVTLTELCINTTLRCGQTFRWRKSGDDEWTCALQGRILSLKQDSEYLHYRAVFPQTSLPSPANTDASHIPQSLDEYDDTLHLIRHYFNLKPNLTQLYEQWAAADSNFKKKAPKFTGIRILQQDSWEALVGFICSSNNNIARISQMVDKLCINYGPLIGYINDIPYHDFPQPHTLTGSEVEGRLRALGFGYRSRYLWKTACSVDEKGLQWLDGLRNPEKPKFNGPPPSLAGELEEGGRKGYREAAYQLLELQGVGPKVADCVCLFGLGWGESVPVDTHVWQIAQRDYKFGKGKNSSLTKATYDAIANKFRGLWGKEAGWAHSVLFTADLRTFSERLVKKVSVKEDVSVKIEGAIITKTTHQTIRKRIKREFEDLSPLDIANHVRLEGQSKRFRHR